jgi:CHAT domain-containing protein
MPNKHSLIRTLIEFTIFSVVVIFLSRQHHLFSNNIDFSSSVDTLRTILFLTTPICFSNIKAMALLVTIYIFNKFILKKRTPNFLNRALLYSLALFLIAGVAVIWASSTQHLGSDNSTQPVEDEKVTFFGGIWKALSIRALQLLQENLNGNFNPIALCFSAAILLPAPCILSWCGTGILYIVFLFLQLIKFKTQRITTTVLFISLKISLFLSKVVVICTSVTLIFIGIVAFLLATFYTWQLVTHQTFTSSFSYLTLIIWFWVASSFTIVVSISSIALLIKLLSSISSGSVIYKALHVFVWKVYFPVAKLIQLKIIPFTIFSPISIASYSLILHSLISFQEKSFFVIDEVETADNLTDFTLSYITDRRKLILENKSALTANKLKTLQIVARQMILMGNIKQAEKLYATLLQNIDGNIHNRYKKIVDDTLKELIEFYLRLNQKDSASFLHSRLNHFFEKGNLSFINKISIQMIYNFYFNRNCDDFKMGRYSSELNQLKVSEMVRHLIEYSINSWQINKPQDLNKWLLYTSSEDKELDYALKQHASSFSVLIDEVKSIFIAQEKIFSLAQGRDCDFSLTLNDINRAMSDILDFNILGIKLSFPNPFVNKNYILVPLIIVESSPDFSLEVINSFIDRAIVDNRTFDLALLYCCQGKILVNLGEANAGFSLLRDGISLFEGIRSSVSSDRLGIGFGDEYLKFYDWAIDAAIKVGDIRQAFDYSEHAKARAMLDLLCQRTSHPASGSLQENIAELKNLDFSAALVDSSTYSQPSYLNLLPNIIQKKIRLQFYNRKKDRIQKLHKKRSIIFDKINRIDPISSSLVTFKPLSWNKNSDFKDHRFTYSELWENQSIADNEAMISYHGLCDRQFTSRRQWNKIICFYLFAENEEIRLDYLSIDKLSTVTQAQENLQEILEGIHLQSRKSNLGMMSISELLTQPLIKKLPAHLNKLLILGNDEFQFTPWSAMYFEEDESSDLDRHLIDCFKIRTIPSLSLLFLLKEREGRRDSIIPSRFVISGVSHYPKSQDFLYWAGFEVDSIASLHNTKPIKDEAVDIHFIDKFRSSEIIHFCGHANYQVDESLNGLERTYLRLYHNHLSAAQILDGALQSSTAKVMILSACLTGRGDLIGAGSEILGLERSLFYTGLSTLITTLWQVDDVATSLLMVKFHSIWKHHNNSLDHLSASLANAQIWLKNASWQDCKNEINSIDAALKECIEVCSILIENELSKNPSADLEALKGIRHKCLNMQQYDDNKVPFYHPRYWAAFQVKGVG